MTATYDLSEYISDVDNDLSELVLTSSGSEHIEVEITDLEIKLSSKTQHWNGEESITFMISDNEEKSKTTKRMINSDIISVHCIPVDDPTEFDLPQSLLFGPGESSEILLSEYYHEYDGDNLLIQFMGNTEISIVNDSLLYTFSSSEDFLGCENILFIIYDGTSFAYDQMSVCSSITPQELEIMISENNVELSWKKIMVADSYKIYGCESPDGIFEEIPSGIFSEVDERCYWLDSINTDLNFYQVVGVINESVTSNAGKCKLIIDEKLKEKMIKIYNKKYNRKQQ